MRISAHARVSKFAHVRLCDDNRAARAQTMHYGRVGRGGLAFFGKNSGANARHFTSDVEQILDADNRPVEWPQRNSGFCARVGGVGGGLRLLAVNREAS